MTVLLLVHKPRDDDRLCVYDKCLDSLYYVVILDKRLPFLNSDLHHRAQRANPGRLRQWGPH